MQSHPPVQWATGLRMSIQTLKNKLWISNFKALQSTNNMPNKQEVDFD